MHSITLQQSPAVTSFHVHPNIFHNHLPIVRYIMPCTWDKSSSKPRNFGIECASNEKGGRFGGMGGWGEINPRVISRSHVTYIEGSEKLLL
jgi:hypothetical protein